MAHQSLYRKYRPQTFDDVVGQAHITRTLRNALEEGAVAHAYLFSGPRGTGKTTTARILAKALNCVKGPTPDPDDTCENCRDITEGRHPDVYELDAASRTGVDAVRDEIITKVAYAATRGGWKVYIIDEVHMLSASAFNALLKTLEEPPSRTVFILCTTHPHKVPETIHSRCQRFDFRRISVEDIVGRLSDIAAAESISTEDGVLSLIARHALGGMRDAIGTLDQLAAFTGKNVTLDDVEGLLGEIDTSRLLELTAMIAVRDAAGCFRFVAALAESGTDIPEFVRGLTQHVRDLYVVAATGAESGVLDVTDAELRRLGDQAATFGLDRLSHILDVLGELAAQMRWAPDPRLALEVSLTRMARPESDLTLEALVARIAALEAGGGGTASTPAAEATPAERPQTTPVQSAEDSPPAPRQSPEERADVHSGPAVPPKTPTAPAAASRVGKKPVEPPVPAGSAGVAALRRAWPDVLRAVKAERPMVSKALLDTEVGLDGDTLVVEFPSDRRTPMRAADEPEIKELIRSSVLGVTGMRLAVRYQLGRGHVQATDRAAGGPQPADASLVSGPAADPQPAPAGSQDGGDPGREAERLLIDGLGAEVIVDDSNDKQGGAAG